MLLQFINVVHPRLIDLLLDDASYLVIDRVEVRTVWWSQIWCNESRRCLLEKLYSVSFVKIWPSNFRKVKEQHTKGMVGSIVDFVGNLVIFPAVKEFWKSVKNWQSYRHEFGVLHFWDIVYIGILWTNNTHMVSRCSLCTLTLKVNLFWCHWQADDTLNVYCNFTSVIFSVSNLPVTLPMLPLPVIYR